MPTSGSTNWSENRDDIIKQALQICQEIGAGEAASTTAISDAIPFLNNLIKAWNADGMALWTLTEGIFTMTAGTAVYSIGSGTTWNAQAPLRVLQGWLRDSNNYDTPLEPLTRYDYNRLSAKSNPGRPTQYMYNPPGDMGFTQILGTVYLYPTPDASAASTYSVMLSYQKSFEDFDASTDILNFPSYWNRAVVWGLAAELAYIIGVPLAERAMISKKAEEFKTHALGLNTEEGSIKFQPNWMWMQSTRS